MDRRTFVRNVSIAALASPFYGQSCKMDPDIPIIDTHQHLWDLNLFPLSWVKPPLDRSYLTEDYLKAVEGQNVVKAVYMEVGVPAGLKKKEAEWALALCKDPGNPTVGAVISTDPTVPEFESYIRTFEGNPYLKGIRYFSRSEEKMMQKQTLDNISLLGDMGLSFDLNIPPGLLEAGSQLIDECPNTRFILNHCGNADPVAFFEEGKEAPREPQHDRELWYREMKNMAQRENVICKISGIVDNVPDYLLSPEDLSPIINHCYEVFGSDRVIFAGDWPVCLRNMPLAGWIETLKEVVAGLSITDQRKLFHDNASAFYGLDD
ncbi:amidohydrolase family protein [Bacteroidota bacterium]